MYYGRCYKQAGRGVYYGEMISPRRCYRNPSSVYRVTKQIGLDTLSLTRVNCNFTLFPIQLRYCVSLQRFVQRSVHFKWTEDTGIFLILFLKHCLFDQSKEYASRWSKARNVSRVRWLECNHHSLQYRGILLSSQDERWKLPP